MISNEFEKYINSLPEPLDRKEQEILFYEYSKTRDENIRQKLFLHNLRLCASYATQYCFQHNISKQMEDINSECSIVLDKAINTYDVTKGYTFSTFLFSCLDNIITNHFVRRERDALSKQVMDKLPESNGEDNRDVFYFLEDPNSSNFIDEVLGTEAYNDILSYINSWKNKRDIEIFKSCYGIDGYQLLSQKEIASKFSLEQATISRILKAQRDKLKLYIQVNFKDMYEEYVGEKKKTSAILFDSAKERNQYIINSAFGIECEKKPISVIATDVGLAEDYVIQLVHKFKKGLTDSEKDELKIERRKKYSDELCQDIFEYYYGVNGKFPMSRKDLSEKFDVKYAKMNSLLYDIKELMIEKGRYSEEELEKLQLERERKLKSQKMEKYANLYNSYYGLNGCEKKSLIILARELKMSYQAVASRIRCYEEYLKNQEDPIM